MRDTKLRKLIIDLYACEYITEELAIAKADGVEPGPFIVPIVDFPTVSVGQRVSVYPNVWPNFIDEFRPVATALITAIKKVVGEDEVHRWYITLEEVKSAFPY